MARRKRDGEGREGIITAQCADPMLALDGSPKQWCVGCGGPRDAEYARSNPCVCCGATGTMKRRPQFDDDGELIVPKPKVKPAPAEQPRVERRTKPKPPRSLSRRCGLSGRSMR